MLIVDQANYTPSGNSINAGGTRRRQLSAVEALDAHLERIQKHNPALEHADILPGFRPPF
jgi:hypothetical protein